MIRHGEKPPGDAFGLSDAGTWRSKQLPGVFGPNSGYNIRYILAEKPDGGICSLLHQHALLMISYRWHGE